MNFVLVNYEYPPLGGGAGNATAQMAGALARQGHAVSVLTAGHAESRGTERIEDGVRVVRLPVRRRRVDRSDLPEMLSYVWAATVALPRFLRRHPSDGVIVYFSLPCGPIGWYARQRTGTPYVISLRGGDVPGAEARVNRMHRLLGSLRRLAMRGATAVVANSHGLAKLSEASDPIPVQVIANGVDTAFFRPPTVRANNTTTTLLFAGRFQPQKNLFVLLDQFATARARGADVLRLVLIGDGAQRDKLQAHALALGIADAVTWPGWLDKTALLHAYQTADIFLNPSLYEGMPNTVLEAMACGLPVIASRVIGNDELVQDGITGMLFDLDAPDQLARAISALAQDPVRRSDMGQRGRQIACESYSWDATAAQYVELFLKSPD